MEDFEQYLQDLRKTREQKNQHSDELLRLQVEQKKLKAEQETADRVGNGDDAQLLKRRQEELNRRVKTAQTDYAGAKSRANDGLLGLVERFGSPQRYIAHWDDHLPILLFPLRVETRFNPARPATNPELWVRVFPDECSVIKFRPELSENEQAAATAFWFETWKASDETARLGAWTALVQGFGPQRAAWIAKTSEPANFNELDADVFNFPSETVLQNAGLSPDERVAGKAYWRQIWFGRVPGEVEKALETDVGAARVEAVKKATKPGNWDGLGDESPGKTFQGKAKFPPFSPPTEPGASYADVLPDQLVFMGFEAGTSLFEVTGKPIPDRIWLSPDVQELDGAVTRDGAGKLQFSGELEWVQNFDAAVNLGLGMRIDLRAVITSQVGSSQAEIFLQRIASNGLDRLMVLGINAVDGKIKGSALLEKLFTNHHFGSSGLGFVPQGTPTNNTEGTNAGLSRETAAEESFAVERGEPLFEPLPNQPFYAKPNGQRTAEFLGISPTIFQHIAHSQDRELAEARAMNIALFNATLGYYFDEMLDPLIPRADQHRLFTFFTEYVSGRGSLPALRIGRQPYGILPTTAFSRWTWTNPEMREGRQFRVRFYEELQRILRVLREAWRLASVGVAHAGRTTPDLNQQFLEMLGLNPTSVSYAHRWLYGQQFVRNYLFLITGKDVAQEQVDQWDERAKGFLRQFGALLPQPGIVSKSFSAHPVPLKNVHLIDSLPLSEERSVQPLYTKTDGTPGPNYLSWLRQSSETDIGKEALLSDTGVKIPAPATLLYALLRHAVQHSYWDTAMKLYEDFKVVDHAARREVEVSNVVSERRGGEAVRQFSKTDYLQASVNDNLPNLSDKSQTMSAFLSDRASIQLAPDSNLHLVREALAELEKLPTARLERLLAEHIDLCSYRLDGWETGFLQKRLEYLRYDFRRDGEETPGGYRPGSYLGAFGWVEDLKPAPVRAVVNRGLPAEFGQEGPIYEASQNGAFIHAPSLPQAVTSALLRSGYLAHADRDDRERLSINLSSERVRRSLWLIEGIRKGQELAALLGYQFERALHDAQLDVHIYAFREGFPFKIKETEVQAGQSLEAISARNVVDGYALGNTNPGTYPFGLALPANTSVEGKTLLKALDELRDSMDAVGDTLLAESVHQFVQGNQLKANASLKTLQEGQNPTIPDFVQTPRSGNAITSRVFINLDATAVAAATDSPRVQAEPALNQWLTGLLGTHLTNARVVVQRQGTETIDLPLSELGLTFSQWDALSEIQQNGLLETEYRSTILVPMEAGETVQISVTRVNNSTSDAPGVRFEATRILKKEIALSTLALSALDWVYLVENQQVELDKRIAYEFYSTHNQVPNGRLLVLYPEPVLAGEPIYRLFPLLRALQQSIRKSRPLHATDYRVPGESKPDDVNNIGRVDEVELRLRATKLQDACELLRVDFQNEVSGLETILANADPEATKLADVAALVVARHLTWETLLKRAAGFDGPEAFPEAPIRLTTASVDADFLPENSFLELSKLFEKQTYGSPNARPTFGLLTQLLVVLHKLTGKVAAMDKLLADAVGIPANDQIPMLTQTLQAAAGSGLVIVPKFRLDPDNAAEVQLAHQNRDKLLTFKQQQLQDSLPSLDAATCAELITEEWVQGISRVRPRVGQLERVKLAAEMLSATAPTALIPLQLPYLQQPYWVGLEMPEMLPDPDDATKQIPVLVDRDYLSIVSLGLGNAHTFGGLQCGLLLDEWTEVIPVKTETTGVAVNYNQPNAESPQSWLLAVSPTLKGNWDWDTLVAILNETLERAKQRAVEPDHLANATNLGQLLPATITPQSSDPNAGSFLAYSKLYAVAKVQ